MSLEAAYELSVYNKRLGYFWKEIGLTVNKFVWQISASIPLQTEWRMKITHAVIVILQ